MYATLKILEVLKADMTQRQIADIDTWNMHMRALKRILDTRGGADSIKIPNLRSIIFLVDTAGCCESISKLGH